MSRRCGCPEPQGVQNPRVSRSPQVSRSLNYTPRRLNFAQEATLSSSLGGVQKLEQHPEGTTVFRRQSCQEVRTASRGSCLEILVSGHCSCSLKSLVSQDRNGINLLSSFQLDSLRNRDSGVGILGFLLDVPSGVLTIGSIFLASPHVLEVLETSIVYARECLTYILGIYFYNILILCDSCQSPYDSPYSVNISLSHSLFVPRNPQLFRLSFC